MTNDHEVQVLALLLRRLDQLTIEFVFNFWVRRIKCLFVDEFHGDLRLLPRCNLLLQLLRELVRSGCLGLFLLHRGLLHLLHLLLPDRLLIHLILLLQLLLLEAKIGKCLVFVVLVGL